MQPEEQYDISQMKHTDKDQDVITSRYSRRPQRSVKIAQNNDSSNIESQSTRTPSVPNVENSQTQSTTGQKLDSQRNYQSRDSGKYFLSFFLVNKS